MMNIIIIVECWSIWMRCEERSSSWAGRSIDYGVDTTHDSNDEHNRTHYFYIKFCKIEKEAAGHEPPPK